MVSGIPEEQVRAVLESVALEVLTVGGVYAPPVDAIALAEQLGIVVARDGVANARARFVRLGGGSAAQATILLADEPRPERRQWAVAHEIGESEAYRVFAELGVEPSDAPPAAREAVANKLAGCLLLPAPWFAADGRELDWDLYELKTRYATASHELIARRMLEMEPGAIVTLADHGRQIWRKSNRHFRAPPMTPAELTAWKATHELCQPTSCEPRELADGVEDVRSWPIHEPGWKREIIRTALTDQW
jgi:Zn-dependent peptidase ImmA (M78 family)